MKFGAASKHDLVRSHTVWSLSTKTRLMQLCSETQTKPLNSRHHETMIISIIIIRASVQVRSWKIRRQGQRLVLGFTRVCAARSGEIIENCFYHVNKLQLSSVVFEPDLRSMSERWLSVCPTISLWLMIKERPAEIHQPENLSVFRMVSAGFLADFQTWNESEWVKVQFDSLRILSPSLIKTLTDTKYTERRPCRQTEG